jgi:hypothetical protein
VAHDSLQLVGVDLAAIRQRMTRGVSQRVRVAQPAIDACAFAGSSQKLRKAVSAEVVATLGYEYVVACISASQHSQSLAVIGGQVLLTAHATFPSTDVDGSADEVDRVPTMNADS